MASIPLYRYDGALLDFVGERGALRLEAEGCATLVRHKKTGTINRVILLKREGDPRALALRDYQGEPIRSTSPSTMATTPGSCARCTVVGAT
jgi:hypothetical protein